MIKLGEQNDHISSILASLEERIEKIETQSLKILETRLQEERVAREKWETDLRGVVTRLQQTLDQTRTEVAQTKTELKKLRGEVGLKDAHIKELLAAALIDNDLTPLYIIRLRAVLDTMQGKLAKRLSHPTHIPKEGRSTWWRARLDDVAGEDTFDRVAAAKILLANIQSDIPLLYHSEEALLVLSEKTSIIQTIGNNHAHSFPSDTLSMKALKAAMLKLGLTETQERGMATIIDYLTK